MSSEEEQLQPRPGQKVIDVIQPTYALKPDSKEKFYKSEVTTIIEEVIEAELKGKFNEKWMEDWQNEQTSHDFEDLSKCIADQIKQKCKLRLPLPRYKFIVQITIGQCKDQGVGVSSRCLWDPTTDNYASSSYKDEFIWASVMVFGLYTD